MVLARLSDIKGSHISYFSNLVKVHGGINLAQGIPGFAPPSGLLKYLSETASQPVHQYAPGTGNTDLLARLEERYTGLFNPDTSNFFIANGATEAISLIYTYLHRKMGGAMRVLTFSPAYESYIHLPNIFGDTLTTLPQDDHGKFDIGPFEQVIKDEKIQLVFLCSPGNPRGTVYDQQTLSALADICARQQCYLLIDAVYSDLCFDGARPWYPTHQLSPYVFYVNSFSKLLSVTGWRVGYFLTHQSHYEALKRIHDYIGLSSPAPFQAAIARFLEKKEEVEAYVTEVRLLLANNYLSARERLLAEGFVIPEHQGGYFIWARCPKHIDSGTTLGINLYNKYRTAIIPGAHFGAEWNQYIRINIAQPPDVLHQGVNHIGAAVQKG